MEVEVGVIQRAPFPLVMLDYSSGIRSLASNQRRLTQVDAYEQQIV